MLQHTVLKMKLITNKALSPLFTFSPAFLHLSFILTSFSLDSRCPPKHIHTLLLNYSSTHCQHLLFLLISPQRHFNPCISSAVFFPSPFHPRKSSSFHRLLPLLSRSTFASHPLLPVPQLCQRKSSMKNVLTLHNCRFPHVSHLLDARATCLLNWCRRAMGTHTHPATHADLYICTLCAQRQTYETQAEAHIPSLYMYAASGRDNSSTALQ